ncbi:hypothetical protein ASILVAE211_23540 [Acidisoma silvae]|uniref:Transposase IS204/IS1001/IS1096/IS1165 DDE domain-containing protein n=1 Tax=Acidisoma silvae TaxID=2802396 RepID=A0A964E1F6_9PROT|nr:hypothetical protein [Acidisoma silvae]
MSRDRCGLYTQAASHGAPQAAQVADRFHLLQNFRHVIERQLTRALGQPLKLGPQQNAALQEPPKLTWPNEGTKNAQWDGSYSPRSGRFATQAA